MTTTSVYYDPYDTTIVKDPYPTYRRLREEAPLYYNEQHNFYAVSRHEDVERGLSDWRTFPSSRGGILELIQSGFEIPPGTLIFEDPPVHDLHRSLLVRVFTPRRVSALEPQIREFCAQHLDPLIGEKRFDLIKELGSQMPMKVISWLLGIPESDQEAIRDSVNNLIETEAGGQLQHSEANFDGKMFEEYIDWRAKNPSDDLMTALLTTEFTDETGEKRTLSRAECLTYCMVVAGAGNETTNRLIGWMGTTLSDHPDQRAEIVEDLGLVPNTVEEVLRFEPPGPHIGRYVAQDVEFHGQTVPAGSAILLIAASANRDEAKYPNGDSFDIHRKMSQHLTFGLATHYCLGAALARLEGRIALEEILKRFPVWDVDYDSARLSSTSTVRGWETLPIEIG